MKTKILSCLAALLLTSTSAFAQSAVKADVNDDGIVDVADVVSVAAIKKAGAAIPINSIELASIAEVYTGIETQLSPIILPTYATDKTLIWSSSNTSVATVSQTGVVKGVAEGTTTITATTSNGKKATCEVTVHLTVYYWYVGQTDPSTMTEISPIVDDNTSPGWRLIGATLPTYSSSNKLWSANDVITTGTTLAKQYIAIPAESSACPRVEGGTDASTADIYNRLSNVTISGVSYKVYVTVGKSRKYGLDTY